MNDIAGIPYLEAQFDKDGLLLTSVDLPAGATDVVVMSHGWNNNAERARGLYRDFFTNFAAAGRPGDLGGRSLAIVGVIWPSKEFDEMVAVSAAPGGSAGFGGDDSAGRKALERKLDAMKDFFTEPEQQAVLDAARALVPDLESKGSARREFVNRIRSLLDPSAASRDDASSTFFKDDGDALMQNLKVDADDLDEALSGSGGSGGSAALPLGVATAVRVQQGAAGLTETITGFKAAAMNILNYTTYYEMKARAGTVGKDGVAKLIDAFPAHVQRIHLVGHSFGGRLVASTAASSATDRIASMALLQAAFSHNGFSKTMNGFFRTVADQGRIHGPILVTHTKNDSAVGVLYPLASRINGDKTAAFGDENDVFGGIGRNGTQKMPGGEAVFGKLLAAGGAYTFEPARFFNLEASDFVKNHSDITGKEVTHAVRSAIAG